MRANGGRDPGPDRRLSLSGRGRQPSIAWGGEKPRWMLVWWLLPAPQCATGSARKADRADDRSPRSAGAVSAFPQDANRRRAACLAWDSGSSYAIPIRFGLRHSSRDRCASCAPDFGRGRRSLGLGARWPASHRSLHRCAQSTAGQLSQTSRVFCSKLIGAQTGPRQFAR